MLLNLRAPWECECNGITKNSIFICFVRFIAIQGALCTNTDYISSCLLPLNLAIPYLMLWRKAPNGPALDCGLFSLDRTHCPDQVLYQSSVLDQWFGLLVPVAAGGDFGLPMESPIRRPGARRKRHKMFVVTVFLFRLRIVS